jgi:glycosyltransferase involved in cell wall biosynthesis
MRLVVVTQQVDPVSPVLGATVPKLRALAARVDELVVLADRAVENTLPSNCRVHLFRSRSRLGRGIRFETALARELARGPRPAAVLAHMCPIYAVLAAPIARPLGTEVMLWFTHWRRSRLLSVAERLSTTVVTVDARTFPLPSRKLVPIGHGIDTTAFPCVERPPRESLILLALGRTSSAKGLETVVRAVALDSTCRLVMCGPSATPAERAHKAQLEALVAELDLGSRVEIREPVPHDAVPALFAEADVLVNNMREGATDKVVYEAAAACLPVLASNTAFDSLLPPELRFEGADAVALAKAIGWVRAADRSSLGRSLRETVVREHSAEHWADRVVELAGR